MPLYTPGYRRQTCGAKGCTSTLHRPESRRLGFCTEHVPICSACGRSPRARLVKGVCEDCYSTAYREKKWNEKQERRRATT